jgi:hypothetical protein
MILIPFREQASSALASASQSGVGWLVGRQARSCQFVRSGGDGDDHDALDTEGGVSVFVGHCGMVCSYLLGCMFVFGSELASGSVTGELIVCTLFKYTVMIPFGDVPCPETCLLLWWCCGTGELDSSMEPTLPNGRGLENLHCKLKACSCCGRTRGPSIGQWQLFLAGCSTGRERL